MKYQSALQDYTGIKKVVSVMYAPMFMWGSDENELKLWVSIQVLKLLTETQTNKQKIPH